MKLFQFGIVCVFVSTPRVGSAFCLERSDNSRCHPEITTAALSFIRPSILEETIQANWDQDDGLSKLKAGPHFDECAFDAGAESIRGYYYRSSYSPFPNEPPEILGVLPGWSPSGSVTYRFWGAVTDFGNLTHTCQDFYAHTNWVELDRSDLFQGELGEWPSLDRWDVLREDILMVGRDVPDGWSIARVSGSFVPYINTRSGTWFRGLVSGTTHAPIANCANGADWSHDTLNKDGAERGEWHFKAAEIATRQTEFEWCRTLTLLQDTYGSAGPSVPLGLLVAPGANAHPASTPCGPSTFGAIEMTVTAQRIKVLNANDVEAGDLNYVLAAYTTDLTQSNRSQGALRSLNDEDLVPDDALPSPITMCLTAGQALVTTVQGWEDDDGPSGVLSPAGFFGNNDDIVAGVVFQGASGAEYQAGIAGGWSPGPRKT